MKSAVRVWVGAGLLMLLPALSAGAWHITQNIKDPTESGQPVGTVLAEVTMVTNQVRTPVGYSLEFRAGEVVRTAASGLLTSLPAPGEVLVSGAVVAKIDNRQLVGYQSTAPFWRDLKPGDNGDDVSQLQTLLLDWGYLEGETDGKYGQSTAQAVFDFNADHLPGAKSREFRRDSVVWLGSEPFTIESPLKATGEQISAGDGMFQSAQELDAIVVAETSESRAVLAGQEVLEFQLGEFSVPYQPGQSKITAPESIAALAAELSPSGDGVGYLVGSDIQQLMSVPASALVTDQAGNKCVLQPQNMRAVAVNPVGGGISSVSFEPVAGLESVIANPNQVVLSPSCG